MKTKNSSSLVIGIIGIAVIVILLGILIAWGLGLFKDKKQEANAATAKIDSATQSMADFDLLAYDDYTIKGGSLIDLITEYKTKDVQVSLWVYTLDKISTYYNYALTTTTSTSDLGAAVTVTPPASKSADGYITETANFLGSVIRNENNQIVCLKFTQQK